MRARHLFSFLAIVCIFCLPITESNAQTERINNKRLRSSQKIDLSTIVGRCGCEACSGRLEHNNPVEDEKEGDGANNFQLVTRWSATAMSGGGLGQGDPTILTWSIIPDGTDANGGGGFVPSNMIAVWDNVFNEANAGNPDLTTRFWHGLIQQALDRWSEVSGLEYVYEPNDDGVANFGGGGFVGVRGDVRIGGFNIDGPNNILAFNSFPNEGDMAVDTSDTGNFGFSQFNFRIFRNIYTHENGHGIGFAHVESNNAQFLMEPSINIAFDGPQLDDVRAVQRGYGDVFEKSNNGAGNNTFANATDLGSIGDGSTLTIGTDGATGTVVNINDDDFVSVDDNSDTDFYRINLAQSSLLNIALTPVGASYNQSAQGGGGGTPTNPSTASNLTLALFTPTGILILQVNDTGNGGTEVIENQLVASGDTLIRVTGNTNAMQLYTLSIDANFGGINSVPPESVTIDAGTVTDGELADVGSSDDQSFELQAEVIKAGNAPISAEFEFTAEDPIPSLFSLTYEGAGTSFNVNQTTSMFNRDTDLFEVVDSRLVEFDDVSFEIDPVGDHQRFINFLSGELSVEIRYEPTGPVLAFPWSVSIDELLVNTAN